MDNALDPRDRVTQYALDVIEGRIQGVGTSEKQACQRHLDDIEKSKVAPYKYYFDIDQALDIIDFAENLTIIEGEEAIEVHLYGFQSFILGSLNGWRKKEGGHRRFRTSYVQIGRQNGKSFLNGILAAYYGNFSGYNFGQIYCTATQKKQAKIVFNEVSKFIKADTDLQEYFDIKDYKCEIHCLSTESVIQALSKDTDSIDGFRPYLGIVDEYHAHKTNQMYKLLEGGTKKLKSCLISVITTAGFNLNGPCYQLYKYCKSILQGIQTNDSQFVFITEINEGLDIWDPENWPMANPSIRGNEEEIENMKPVAAAAKAMGGEDLRDFITKQLNCWFEDELNQYIKVNEWAQGACDLTLDDFKGKECVVGLDLSSGGDLTTFALEFTFKKLKKLFEEDKNKKLVEVEKEVDCYYFYTHSFIPAMRLEEHIKTDNAPYDVWASRDVKIIGRPLLSKTFTAGGIKTDYQYIINELKELIEKYNLKVVGFGYDPANADTFLQDIGEIYSSPTEIRQTHKYLNDATQDFQLECRAGNVYYNRVEELLSWSVTNAKTVSNKYGEIKIDKEQGKVHRRIDPVDAIIDAHSLVFAKNKNKKKFDINKSAALFLNKMNVRG